MDRLEKIINKYSATPTDNRDVEQYYKRKTAKEAKDNQIEQLGRKEEKPIKYTIVDGVRVPF